MRHLLLLFLVWSSLFSVCSAQVVLISESFGGLGTSNLNGTSADTFSTDLTNSGGDSTWRAASSSLVMAANGTLTLPASSAGSTYLKLGSYINSSKGTDSSKFVLTATITKPSAATWITLGFFGTSATDNSLSGNTFIDAALPGYATALHRFNDSSGNNFYMGSQSNGGSYNPGNLTGTLTFKVELDFTSASGYNGTTNFGTARYYSTSDLNTVAYSNTYTSSASIAGVGFSYSGGTSPMTATVSNFSLTQVTAVPEPRYYSLTLLLIICLLYYRSRSSQRY